MVTLGFVPFGLVTVTFGLGVFGPVIMVTFGVVPLAVIVMLVLRLALIRIVLSAARVAIDGAALVKTLGLACSVTLGVDWALVCTLSVSILWLVWTSVFFWFWLFALAVACDVATRRPPLRVALWLGVTEDSDCPTWLLGVSDCDLSWTVACVVAWPCETCSVVSVSWALAWVCEETATSWSITWLLCAWAVASWATALVVAWELVSWLTLAVATAATLAWALACSVTVVVVTRLAVPSSLSCCKPSPLGALVSSASTFPWARRLPPAKATIERVVTPIVTQFFLTLCSLKRTLFSIYNNHPFFLLFSLLYDIFRQITNRKKSSYFHESLPDASYY